VELEIGCGKGGFLLRRAQEHPEKREVGIEWANKFFKYAADRMARWALTNVRIMRTDARHLLCHQLAADCLDALHVYHPDPWPKKRHHKRRLFSDLFVEKAIAALRPGARWAIQTDHADYFEWISQRLDRRPELQEIPYDDPTFGIIDEEAGTNFEIKYKKEGRPIYRLAYEKSRANPTSS
ncbi:MAG: tRNA (guanosine(46)-N7)-methyltransferase TrmB, partial [Phycisphaerae bacterium]